MLPSTPGPSGRHVPREPKGGTPPRKIVVEVVIEGLSEVWIEAAKQGCDVSLGRAFESCRTYLIRTAEKEMAADLRAKEDVSDLVQETFLEAFLAFGQFTGRTASDLQFWLRSILLNNLRHAARRYRVSAKRDIAREVPLHLLGRQAADEPNLMADTSSPSGHAMKKEWRDAVHQALARLPEQERRAFILRSESDCTFEEMGRRLGCSTVTARKRWLNAVNRLWTELGLSPLAS